MEDTKEAESVENEKKESADISEAEKINTTFEVNVRDNSVEIGKIKY